MRFIQTEWAAALLTLLPTIAHAGEDDDLRAKVRAKAQALLSLTLPGPTSPAIVPGLPTAELCDRCEVDAQVAVERAAREKLPLFVWVAGCKPVIRSVFPRAVHLSVPSWAGDDSPRLIVTTPKGLYVLRAAALENQLEAIRRIRSILQPSPATTVQRHGFSLPAPLIVAQANC